MKVLTILAAFAVTCVAITPPSGIAFDHIFIVWMEEFNATLFPDAFKAYIPSGVTLTNYHGVATGTQPNHIAALGGDYFGIGSDDTVIYNIPSNFTTIVDLLEPAGLTWREYAEDLPSACYTGSSSGEYYRIYNGFVSFNSITLNSTRCANVVPGSQLMTDIQNGALPNFAIYNPNAINNGDNTNFSTGASWFNGFMPSLLTSGKFLNRTLVMLVFDDAYVDGPLDPTVMNEGQFNNGVYALIFGDVVPTSLRNTTDTTFYTHYSILSTVEANWKLGNLNRNDINKPLSNVIDFVASATGYTDETVSAPNEPNLTAQEPGYFNPNSNNSPTSSSDANASLPNFIIVPLCIAFMTITFIFG